MNTVCGLNNFVSVSYMCVTLILGVVTIGLFATVKVCSARSGLFFTFLTSVRFLHMRISF